MNGGNTIFGKYICLDIVSYTRDRLEQEQLTILGVLNQIVKDSLSDSKYPLTNDGPVLCLPTGDGMCIVLINNAEPEIHIEVALKIMEGVAHHNDDAKRLGEEKLIFQIRIGINAHTDNLVTDVNGHRNVAGVGINTAFRIMDLADGEQILVGSSVYYDQKGRRFEKSFVPHTGVVRHGMRLDVYQLLGKGLDENTPSKIQNYEDLVNPAAVLGLRTIYVTRSPTVREDVLRDIENAVKRVWLLGVSLNHVFSISDPRVQEILKSKLEDGVDVRILLLDGLRSPAVFRALVESDADEFANIITSDRCDPRNPPADDPYLNHPLFTNFRDAYTMLERLGFKTAARFYAHIPNCWLVVTDNTIYYQPYTFGGAHDVKRMPVIKVDGPEEAPYKVLKDHFDKLWQTSEFDLFQAGARIKAQEIILGKLFENRLDWFKHVYGVLYNEESPGQDRRTFQRQRCICPSLVASVTWPDGKETKAKIINHSRTSVLLALRASEYASERFESLPEDKNGIKTPEIIVKLDITSPKDKDKRRGFAPKEQARKYLVNKLLKHESFRYARKEKRTIRTKEQLCIALSACEKHSLS